jgi:Tfp pilus assembly major pilin PilA
MSNLGALRRRANDGFTMLEVVFVLGAMLVLAGISLPYMKRTLGSMRLSGAARSISNGIAVVKLRSASKFTRARLYVDRTNRSFHFEILDTSVTPNHWTVDGGTTYLPSGVIFGFGPVATPPPNTQTAINHAGACTDDALVPIGNTSCVMFNSRGIPVQSAPPNNPEDQDAIYLTDGTDVYGVTVLATGFIGTWHTPSAATPAWVIS